jgi:tripartite-type tricarboxylate transporter receptor subunit TctC
MKLPRRKFLRLAAGGATWSVVLSLAAIFSPPRALGQDAYPSRPIHVIVGFTPGGAADVNARVLSQEAGPILGQQIVVENRSGGGSSIAANYVAHAKNDGYTLFLGTLSIITNQIINPHESLDLMKDFAPIAPLESGAVILVVNPDSNIHSVAELVALAKAKPGNVLHATVFGTFPHFASELFAQRAGIKLTHVPYQGSPQAVMDVIAGRATMTFSPASSVIGQIAAGKLRALATATKNRTGALPDVPTMAETGIPDMDTSLWLGLLAPAGTPRPIIDKVAAAAHTAMRTPKAVETMRKQGYEPLDGGPDEFAALIRSEITRWSDVARAGGLKR